MEMEDGRGSTSEIGVGADVTVAVDPNEDVDMDRNCFHIIFVLMVF